VVSDIKHIVNIQCHFVENANWRFETKNVGVCVDCRLIRTYWNLTN